MGNEGLLKLLNRGINVLGVDYGQNQAYRYADGLYSYSFFDLVRQNLEIFVLGILAVAAVIIFCCFATTGAPAPRSGPRPYS